MSISLNEIKTKVLLESKTAVLNFIEISSLVQGFLIPSFLHMKKETTILKVITMLKD